MSQYPVMYGGYPAQPMVPGYVAPTVPQYIAPAPVAASKRENPIGKEGYELLRKKGGSKVDFFASREEVTRAMCDHTYNGYPQLDVEDFDRGIYRCRICGAAIDTGTDFNPEVIKNMYGYMRNAWDQLKIRNNGVLSNDIIQDMAKAMVLVERLPAAMEVVNKNFIRNEAIQQHMGYRGFNQAQQALNAINGSGGFAYSPTYNPMAYAGQPVEGFVGNPFMGPTMMPPMPAPAPAPMPVAPAPAPVYMAAQAQQAYPVATGVAMYTDPYTGVTYPVQQGQPAAPVAPQPPQYTAPPQAAGTVVPEAPVATAPTVAPASKHEINKTYSH